MTIKHNILFIIAIIALIFIIIDLVKTYCKCPETIYRFIPRTFKEEQESPVPIDHLFKTMFEYPSPWVHTFDIHKSRKYINDDFISQG